MPGIRDAIAAVAVTTATATGAHALSPGGGPVTGERVAVSAYVHAAQTASCGQIDWRDLAAIRSIESPGSIGSEQADGTVPGVEGPALDGSGVGGNTSALYDADGAISQAWGPMQFLKSSWELFGRDANGDGRADWNNIWDATAASAAHLCASRNAGATRWEALRDYNGSGPHAAAYADRAVRYADALPPDPGAIFAPVAQALDAVSPLDCEIERSNTGAPRITDVADCAAQTTFERLLAGWEATGRIIENDGNRQPVAGLYRMVDTEIARILGGQAPGPATDSQPTNDLRASSSSATGQRITSAAQAWVGREYNPGEPAQCAYFVRRVLADAGVELTPEVTNQTLDGWWTGLGIANSFGGDQGQVIRSIDQLAPGDIVMWANTYGDWPEGSITHVGIYAGAGQIIDRPTAAAPVKLRPVNTFAHFVGAVRLP